MWRSFLSQFSVSFRSFLWRIGIQFWFIYGSILIQYWVIFRSFFHHFSIIFRSFLGHFWGDYGMIFGSYSGHFWVIFGSFSGHFLWCWGYRSQVSGTLKWNSRLSWDCSIGTRSAFPGSIGRRLPAVNRRLSTDAPTDQTNRLIYSRDKSRRH